MAFGYMRLKLVSKVLLIVWWDIVPEKCCKFLFQRAQWHSLLSTKYQRLKPELKLMLSLEDDTQQAQPAASHQEQTQQGYDGNLKWFIIPTVTPVTMKFWKHTPLRLYNF